MRRPPSERAAAAAAARSLPLGGLETPDPVRRAEARRAVVAGLGGAEVAADRVRREVRPLRDVEEAGLMAVRIRAVHDRLRVPGERIDGGDDRCGDARPGHDAPAADL